MFIVHILIKSGVKEYKMRSTRGDQFLLIKNIFKFTHKDPLLAYKLYKKIADNVNSCLVSQGYCICVIRKEKHAKETKRGGSAGRVR